MNVTLNTYDVWLLFRSRTLTTDDFRPLVAIDRAKFTDIRLDPRSPGGARDTRLWSFKGCDEEQEVPDVRHLQDAVRDLLNQYRESVTALVAMYPPEQLEVVVWCDVFVTAYYYPTLRIGPEVSALLAQCRARLEISLYGTLADIPKD